MIKFHFYSLALIFLVSCRNSGEIHYYITNNSDKAISIKTLGIDSISFLVYPNSNKILIDKISGIRVKPKRIKFCPCEGAFLLKTQDTSFKVLKDINNPSNWIKRIVNGKGLNRKDHTTCEFIIEQNDIQ